MCVHRKDEERALTGACIMGGVQLAVEQGYRILDICEVNEYLVTQYKPEAGRFLATPRIDVTNQALASDDVV